MQRNFLFLFLIFWVNISSAQLTLSTAVAKDSMQIAGDNIYKIRVEHSSDVVIRSIDLNPLQADPIKKMEEAIDTITVDDPALKERKQAQLQEMIQQYGFTEQVMEIKNKGAWEGTAELIIPGSEAKWKTQTNGNTIIKENSLAFTFWENGSALIFSPVIEYEQNGVIKTTTNRQIMVHVIDPLAKSEVAPDSLSIQPNKEIIGEPFHLVEDLLIPLGTVLLVVGTLVGLIYLFLRKRKLDLKPKTKIAPPKKIIPAAQIAFEKLKKLREEKIWQADKVKEYQSQLTYVIREYLENRYDINALENTTFEIGKDLEKLNLKESLRTDLQNILQVADLVKFAKAKPDENVHEQFLIKAEEFVQTTKKTTAQIDAEKAAQEIAYQQALDDLKNENKKT